jgi:probable F420-dependent oxidoreductase
MRVGVVIPNCMEGLIFPYPFADDKQMVEMAVAAEAMGFDSLSMNDHFTTQHYVARMWPAPPRYYEPLMLYAYIAAVTRRVHLETGILVLPMRDPIVLAKQVSTLDVLSGGRLLLGIGLGAYREEFEAAHAGTPRPSRKALLEERLVALRELLTKPKASFEGRYVHFRDIEMFPRPVQNPVPIYSGGNSRAGLERAARFCDGWLPAILTPAETRRMIAEIREHAARIGRDLNGFDFAVQQAISIAPTRAEARRRFLGSQLWEHLRSLKGATLKFQDLDAIEEHSFIGSPEEILDRIHAYREAGATSLPGLLFAVGTPKEGLDSMELFASRVLPAVKRL